MTTYETSGRNGYGPCGSTAFHDVTSGSNGDFAAGAGYDMVTGVGNYDASPRAVGGPREPGTSGPGEGERLI